MCYKYILYPYVNELEPSFIPKKLISSTFTNFRFFLCKILKYKVTYKQAKLEPLKITIHLSLSKKYEAQEDQKVYILMITLVV